MNRRNNPRGAQNRNQQVQQLDSSFVSANGNANNQQQESPKVEPKVEEPVQNNNDTMPVDDAGEDSEGGIGAKMRKIFANRKNLSAADRKRLEKERKARQLRRLRKLLTPKNAVVALHELQGPGMSEFTINTNGQETTAEIVVNNVRYEATAPNKHLAKARASEKALRDLVIAQMAKARQTSESKAPAANNGNNGDTSQNEDVEMSEVSESDDVPMLHLASYALYKLFNEWQNEGFEIPAIKPAKAPVKLTETGVHPLAPKVPKTKADVPSDAPTRHPTALLAFMRPQIPYEDLGSNNNNDPAKREFSVGVTVDGQRFIGDDNDDEDSDELEITDPQIKKEIYSMLHPRTAQAVLQEMRGGLPLGTVIFDPNSPIHEQSGIINYNDIRYYALAQNRRLVKARLAEQIFRDTVLDEMRKIVFEVFPTVDNPMKLEIDAELIFAHDDFPLNHVVSYALHKLEEIWAIDGYALPEYRAKARKLKKAGDTIPGPPRPPKYTRRAEDLPAEASEMNPQCLLAYMRPQARYEELPQEQIPGNPWFIYNLTVGDKEFTGEATSKKLARRNAAVLACKTLFGVEFDEPDA